MKKSKIHDFDYSYITLKNGSIIFCSSYRWSGLNNIELLDTDGSIVALITPDNIWRIFTTIPTHEHRMAIFNDKHN